MRKALEDENRRVTNPPLDSAYIGAVELAFEGKLFLRPAAFFSQLSHI